MPQPFCVALVFLAASAAHAVGHSRSWRNRWMMDNAPPQLSVRAIEGGSLPAPRYITQPQDHFNTSNFHWWQQAYYVNDTFWSPGSDSPIFLCVGGEGPPLDGSAVVNSVHCNVAVEWLQEKKALMFALEHRYYGCHNMSACPVQNFSDAKEALKHLSSRQAIEDIASFVRQMNQQYHLSTANRWVTFGGSYPGMLAGWSRLRHPELIHAAVASSAPVHAKLDMWEYNDKVAYAYTVADNGVGGSEQCSLAIREGHRQLEEMLKSQEGVRTAEVMLKLPNGSLSTKLAQQSMLGEGAAYFPAQGNDPACTQEACNIKKICEIMLNASIGEELHRVLSVRKAQGSDSFQFDPALPNFWYYQTCTEFGFYQTCLPGSKCMFLQIIDVKFMAADCERLYGIDIAAIAYNIMATNKHYGGLQPAGPSGNLGSCVVWPNGEVDPWMTLSVLDSPGPKQPTIFVEGASHHAWTHPSAISDQVSVVEARGHIRRQVEEFLGQDCSESRVTIV